MKSTVLMKAVVSQGSTAWDESKEIGTLKTNLDKTDILSLSNKNLEGDAPHVILFVRDKADGVPSMIFCTKPLSKTIRKAVANKVAHRDIIKALLPLKLANLTVETDEGDVDQTFIIAPGKAGESFATADLVKEAVVNFEDLA
jgi:hypothetical protein